MRVKVPAGRVGVDEDDALPELREVDGEVPATRLLPTPPRPPPTAITRRTRSSLVVSIASSVLSGSPLGGAFESLSCCILFPRGG